MANLMAGEWEMQTRDADRKRKLAQALRTQQQPDGQMIGGVYVAPSVTQRLATLFSNYQGNQMEQDADQMERQAYESQQSKYRTAAERLAQAMQGRPEVVGNNTDDAAYINAPGMVQPSQPATTQDMMRAQLQYAQEIGDPAALTAAAQGMANYGIRQEERTDDREYRDTVRKDEQEFRAREAQLQREAQERALVAQIEAREQAGRDAANLRRELAEMQMRNSRELAQFTINNRQPQAPVAVMGPDGKPVLVAPAQAYGQRPYSAKQEAADAIKTQQQEQARISAQQVLDQAANIYSHPGRKAGTGASSFVSKIPGTDARGFQANLDTFKAQTFVPMVSALKGMGALSDAEGKKLAESVGALDPSMPEAEFEKSIKGVTKTLYDKAKASGLNVSLPDFAGTSAPTSGWSIKRKQ